MNTKQIEWGPVIVTKGRQKGRVGELDDEEWNGKELVGIVYFGTTFLHASSVDIPFRSIQHATTNDFFRRSDEIWRQISRGAPPIDSQAKLDLLFEYHYIHSILTERWFEAQETRGSGCGVFLSHSSKDKTSARYLAVDLAKAGFRPWFDEWEILPGDSIPKRLSQGLEECRAVVVLLSPEATKSEWVEREWHAKYWEEIERRQVMVIPLLLKPCKVPTLLRAKRYADCTTDFSAGVRDVLQSLRRLSQQAHEPAASRTPG
jgi:hypothetical protein